MMIIATVLLILLLCPLGIMLGVWLLYELMLNPR